MHPRLIKRAFSHFKWLKIDLITGYARLSNEHTLCFLLHRKVRFGLLARLLLYLDFASSI